MGSGYRVSPVPQREGGHETTPPTGAVPDLTSIPDININGRFALPPVARSIASRRAAGPRSTQWLIAGRAGVPCKRSAILCACEVRKQHHALSDRCSRSFNPSTRAPGLLARLDCHDSPPINNWRPCTWPRVAAARRPALAIQANHRIRGLMMRPNTDRRSAGRSIIGRGALLFFDGQPGTRGCSMVDFSHRGVKLRTHDLPVLPVSFKLTFDNFITVQKCRLIWRKGDFIGAAFEN